MQHADHNLSSRSATPSRAPRPARLRWLVHPDDLLPLAAILLVAVAVRIAWIAYVNVDPLDGRTDDSVFYFISAESLASSFEYRDVFGRITAHWPPGYPMLLAPVFAVFGQSVIAPKVVNVILAALACVLTYHLGARAFTRPTGLAGAGILALFPGQIYFSTLVMTEVFFGFLFLLFLTLLLHWTVEDDPSRLPAIALLGALAGVATLVRAEMLLFTLTVPALWLVHARDWRRAAARALPFFAGFALALTPWTVRNAIHFGEFIPVRSSAEGALASALDPDYRSRAGGITGESPELAEQLRYMAQHPWELVPLQADKAIDLYGNDRNGIDWAMHEVPPLGFDEAQRWAQLANIYYFIVGAWALLALPLWLRRAPPARLALAYAAVAWSATTLIFWPESRYHFAIVPVLCVFAAAFAVQVWHALSDAEASPAPEAPAAP